MDDPYGTSIETPEQLKRAIERHIENLQHERDSIPSIPVSATRAEQAKRRHRQNLLLAEICGLTTAITFVEDYIETLRKRVKPMCEGDEP